MADDSLIPDDLLRQIIGVGQVDVLVGVPTLDHGDAVADIVDVVRACFRTHFPRQRTALLNVDRGSADGTTEALHHAWAAAQPQTVGSHGLRTTHCMSTSLAAQAADDAATRCLLAAGDLLQASAVVVLDADVSNLTPTWIAALATPARDRQVDLVAPAYRRHAADGLLVTQLMRPLFRAVHGCRLNEPLLAEFGCSGRLAARCTQAGWVASAAQRATHVWVVGEALGGGFTVRQADLGPRLLRADRRRGSLSEIFRQVVGSAFATIEAHSATWTTARASVDLPLVGPSPESTDVGPRPATDGGRMVESFEHDVAALDEILRGILASGTLAAIVAGSRAERPRFPADLWAATVADFLVAYHQGVMRRDHIAQALLPLYTARTGVFLLEHGEKTEEELDAAAENVCLAFEDVRASITERWLQPA